MSRFRQSLIVLAMLSLGLPGCVPVAWVLPPMQMEVGVGVGQRQELEAGPGEVGLAVPMRLGLHPLQLMPSMYDREVDVGLGYQLWAPTMAHMYHGPYLEAMYLIPTSDDPALRSWRFGVGGRGHYLFAPGATGVQGPGVSLKFLAEWVTFSQEPVTSCSITTSVDEKRGVEVDSFFCGHAYHYGESSIGVFLEGTRGWLGDENLAALTFGLSFRIPASAGVGFALVGQ